MPLWSMDEWQYLEHEVVADPKGRQWTVALMDVLGQEGDPDMPNKLVELQYSSGRYFTLIYTASGALQRERAYASLSEAENAYRELLVAVIDGSLDPIATGVPAGPGRLTTRTCWWRGGRPLPDCAQRVSLNARHRRRLYRVSTGQDPDLSSLHEALARSLAHRARKPSSSSRGRRRHRCNRDTSARRPAAGRTRCE